MLHSSTFSLSHSSSLSSSRPRRPQALLMPLIMLLILTLTVGCSSFSSQCRFKKWVHEFKEEATGQGIAPKLLENVFADMTYDEKVVHLDRNQTPPKELPFLELMEKVIYFKRSEQGDYNRIVEGRRLLQEHAPLLQKIYHKYGVQPHIIVALWGIETAYGNYTGKYSVVRSLATLAFDGRRGPFFRKELLASLKIMQEGHVAPEKMLGSWAGAIGQCQFMPSNFFIYAEDFDGDGKKDIWSNPADIFASIAHYLQKNGWRSQDSWGSFATVAADFPKDQLNSKVKHTVADWEKMGVHLLKDEVVSQSMEMGSREISCEHKKHGKKYKHKKHRKHKKGRAHKNCPHHSHKLHKHLKHPEKPAASWEANLLTLDLQNAPVILAYPNFYTLLSWNRSILFGAKVGFLADALSAVLPPGQEVGAMPKKFQVLLNEEQKN